MHKEVPSMPNRTIYIADADVPLFEQAQTLAGGNLSAAIAEALRQFVEAREAKVSGFEEITVEVGKIAHSHKRFQGRLLAKGRVFEQNETRKVSYNVYLTPKNNLAVYIRNTPNWNYWTDSKSKRKRRSNKGWGYGDWTNPANEDWGYGDWMNVTNDKNEYRLEVYSSLEELEYNVPPELYEAVAQVLRGGDPDGVEVLDI